MGSGSSAAQLKAIHLDVNGKIQKVIFSCLSSRSDIRETISVAAGAFRGEPVVLFDPVGKLIGIDPEMPENSDRQPRHTKLGWTEEGIGNAGETQQIRQDQQQEGES
ncbi:high affinity cGMP-specific 3',5'-cyclic phosphodiesterase 9A-like [Chiloscyllium plagiosum]|uniref:high affinity cGMP-specific 3',5'-cyclic phosphodiesterase 9A-like n=1 Tax=Chiloscyllium plagiosum TaxID=36176 RepID=UPI001CB87304|nr:high affinity cGMP-specific 3',5'-cyclic phosphodiesterase 9A-like [Chiloscyllium plagiosum]